MKKAEEIRGQREHLLRLPRGHVPEGGRSRFRPARSLALVTAVTALAVVAVVLPGSSSPARHGNTAPSSQSLTSQAIDQFSVDLAAADKNPTPGSVTWVATNEQAAEAVIEGIPASNSIPTGGPPVYVLAITGGNFTDVGAHSAPGRTVPSGTVLLAIVEQSDWTVFGGGVDVSGSAAPNLWSLGTPETDPLAGVRPMTDSQFRAKYRQG